MDEVYGELLLPLASGKTGIEHFNLELGYRYSDYKYQGGIDTYKALIDWGISDTVRFRGGRQVATRAPNIAEMFQAQSQTWSAASPGRPVRPQPWRRTARTRRPTRATVQAQALCERLMQSGATVFYDPMTIQPDGASALWFVNAIGNPNVDPEEATTWTAGFVYTPSTGSPLRDGFSGTIDWYKIEIADMIAVEPGSAVYQACLSTASNPSRQHQPRGLSAYHSQSGDRWCNRFERVVHQRRRRGGERRRPRRELAGRARGHGHRRRRGSIRREFPAQHAARARDASDADGGGHRLDGLARAGSGHVVEQRSVTNIGCSRRSTTGSTTGT